jgi:hypothetical protein
VPVSLSLACIWPVSLTVIDRMMPVLRILRDRHVAKYGERGQRLL